VGPRAFLDTVVKRKIPTPDHPDRSPALYHSYPAITCAIPNRGFRIIDIAINCCKLVWYHNSYLSDLFVSDLI
jgi:hypothetical protein